MVLMWRVNDPKSAVSEPASGWIPTISDESSAREHFAEEKLYHSQDDAHHATDDGHAEEESILRETGRSTETLGFLILGPRSKCITG